MIINRIILLLLISIVLTGYSYDSGGKINTNRLADAIYKTENSKKWPYGIKHHYKHTTPRQACINTIKHRMRDWNGQGDFITYLGLTYSPPAINPNWVRLVHYFYDRGI